MQLDISCRHDNVCVVAVGGSDDNFSQKSGEKSPQIRWSHRIRSPRHISENAFRFVYSEAYARQVGDGMCRA